MLGIFDINITSLHALLWLFVDITKDVTNSLGFVVRLQGNGGRLVLNGFGKSKVVDMFGYGVDSREVKCGTSFLREALPKVHLPIGEAS